MKKTMKRVFAMMLVVVMTIGAAPLSGFVGLDLPEFGGIKKLTDSVSEFFDGFSPKAEAATSGYYTYTVSGGNATITDVSTSISGDITIPSTLGGYSVNRIGDSAFWECTSLTGITIPNGIISIGENAFYNCKSVTNIIIPESVTNIGNFAFYGCGSLTSVTIPDNINIISDYMFYECKKLADITIPDSVTSIGNNAFYYCTSLTNITIPNNVTNIGRYAFYFCKNLTKVKIGNKVTNIDSNAFQYCYSLTSITIPDSVSSIGFSVFSHCINLTNVTIGNGVISIYSDAFYDTALYNDESNWENDVLYIDDYLIAATELISGSVSVRKGTKVIADSAFYNCDSLTSISIPDSVINIGSNTFCNCTGLMNIELSNAITRIYDEVFANCGRLSSIIIPDGVTSIGYGAFANCGGLTIITIGNNVKSIDKDAFYDCYYVTDIYYTGTEEEWKAISISSGNPPFESVATIHFNSTPGGETPNPVYYTVTWDANGGMWSGDDIRKVFTTTVGGNITVPSDPEKDGYEFVGWTPAIPQTMPNCDLTFYAVWQEDIVTPSPEDIAKQKYIDEHVKFAKSSTFVDFKDENLANQFSEIIRDSAEYHWNNFIGFNFFTNYYDVVVAQVISSEEMHNAFVNMMNNYLVNDVRSVYTDIFDSINTIDGSTGLDEFEFFDMFMSKDLSAYKGTPIYNSVLHAFGKNKDDLVAKIFKGTDYVNRGLALASSAVDIVEGITDCVYYKSALDAYRQTNVYFKEVLKMVADSDIDSGLKKAISNFADASNEEDYLEYADTLFTKWKSVGVRKGLKISCDLFLGKLLAGTAKVILNIPLKGGATLASKTLTITTKSGGTVVATAAQVASGAVTGVTLGMTVSSILVNSGDFSYNAAACAHMGDFANAVWPVLTKLEQQLTANPTFENALYFENAFALYKEIQIMSVKDMIAIAEAKNDSFVYWLFGKIEDVSDFVAIETKFRNLNCHTSDFSELLAGEYKRKEATGYKVSVTACPVDVYVYDSKGTLVARVINDFAEVFDNRISVHVIDSVKYFGLPNDEEYSIKISATDEGEMDYSVFEFNGNAVMKRDVSTENIPLVDGKTFTGKIDNVTDTDIENYNLIVSGTGEVIEAEKETDCIHATGISISQTAAEMKVGEKISLSASVIPSYSTDKIAWHSSNESVAKVLEDGTIEAVGGGEAVIKAIANSSVYVECTVKVEGTEEYTITWVWCEEEWSFSYPVGSELPMFQGSVPEGYIFIGYSPEIPDVMPAKNLVLTAIFESVSEHEHSYKLVGVVDSTCETEGRYTYSCICFDGYDEAIPAKGHTPNYSGWSIDEPTCTEDGRKIFYCKVCGKACEEESIPSTGHTQGSWVALTSPSCTEDGEKVAYCTKCGVIVANDVIPATGHTPGEWIMVVDPTTESCGEKIKKCIECNEIVDGALVEELPEVTIINGTITEGTCVVGETITIVPKQIDGKIFRRWSVTGAFVEPIATTNSVLSVYLETEEVTITAEYDDCECKCHKGGITAFFFKIVVFFQKLFGKNVECPCGAKH